MAQTSAADWTDAQRTQPHLPTDTRRWDLHPIAGLQSHMALLWGKLAPSGLGQLAQNEADLSPSSSTQSLFPSCPRQSISLGLPCSWLWVTGDIAFACPRKIHHSMSKPPLTDQVTHWYPQSTMNYHGKFLFIIQILGQKLKYKGQGAKISKN